jgi:hypothetical protein
MLMLRVREQDRDRPDRERHREAILALRPRACHNVRTVSWLRWYQAITWADAGNADRSLGTTLEALREDARSMALPDSGDIGRRQYSSLRRFIEQYSNVLRNPSLVGQISQWLQVGQDSGGHPPGVGR